MLDPGTIFAVRELHGAAVYTSRFYPERFNLTGRDARYKNPGESLLSLLVAKHLRQRLVTLSGEEAAVARECLTFAQDPETYVSVSKSLVRRAYSLLDAIEVDLTQLDGQAQQLTSGELMERITEVRAVRETLEIINLLAPSIEEELRSSPAPIRPLDPYLDVFTYQVFNLQDKVRALEIATGVGR